MVFFLDIFEIFFNREINLVNLGGIEGVDYKIRLYFKFLFFLL